MSRVNPSDSPDRLELQFVKLNERLINCKQLVLHYKQIAGTAMGAETAENEGPPGMRRRRVR